MKRFVKDLLMHSAFGAWIGRIPFVQDLYVKVVWSGRMDQFYGVYDSFADASAFAASVNKVGWDDEALAKLLVRDAETETASREPKLFQTSQFAVMLWLSKLLQAGSTILDFGGAGGVFYEICARHGLLKPPLHWHVVDMPEMVKRGRARHEALQSKMISFGSQLSEAPSSDIMLMLGVMQYLPDPLGESGPGILERLNSLPAHVLINKLPLSDAPDVWTAQNHVSSIIPCRLFNRQKFMSYFESHGYRVRDRWLVPELSAEIPFHPERTLPFYEGLYFERQI